MAVDVTQLPPGAQLAQGNTSKPVGVIQEGYVPNGDILGFQAERFLQAQGQGQIYRGQGKDGALSADLVQRVADNRWRGVNPMAGMNDQTIKAIQDGTVNRDGYFVGDNANFTGYYLEPAAKFVIPQYTPARNMIPRTPGVGIDTINWRAVTDYFGGSGPYSVAAGAIQQQGTPSSLSYNWVNASNVSKFLAYRDIVTFESEVYGRSFEGDVRAVVAAKLIPALMQVEENWIINSGQRCWAPPPLGNISLSSTGGSISTTGTYWFIVTAVNANGQTLAVGGTSPTQAASVTINSGSTNSISFNIFRVPSATSYNIYIGIGSTQPATSAMWLQSAASQFGGASALNDPGGLAAGYFTVTMTANPATSGTAYSTLTSNTAIVAKSTDANTLNLPLTFDGLQSLVYLNSGTASTIGVQGETPIIRQPAATSGALQLSDLDTLLENMFLNAHADPEIMFVSVKDHKKLSYLVANGTNFRINAQNNAQDMSNLVLGQRVTKYINQTTGKLMDVVMLPYLAQGTIIIQSMTIPFPVSAIEKPPLRIEVNREMWAVEYPPDQSHNTQWMYAAYLNETVVNQYLGGSAILNGITTA